MSGQCKVTSGQWLVVGGQWLVARGKWIATAVALIGMAAVAAPEKNNAKNLYDVRFGTVPENYESLLKSDFGSWDFNFRPYGRTTDLWTDPAAARDVGEGKAVEGKPTAIRVSCDEDGWTFLVYCAEPGLAQTLAEGKAPPYPTLEVYLCEGDADNSDIVEYWQFISSKGGVREYPWAVPSRRWRPLKPYLRHEVREAPNAYVTRFSFPWAAFWDRLPVFSGKRDNFWRLSAMRWAAGGWSWGGVVHEPDRFGYIRWPEFTEAQKSEILARVLSRGWLDFSNFCSELNYDTSVTNALTWSRASYVRTEPYAVEAVRADGPRTWMLAAEDPELRPLIDGLRDECRALAPTLARFRELPYAEQAAFYLKAAPKLFNFRYDVEAAFDRHARAKIMEGR